MEIYKAGITYYWKSIAGYSMGGYQTETVGYYHTKEKAKKKIKEHVIKREQDPNFRLSKDWVLPITVE
jgi:hypothetical protein